MAVILYQYERGASVERDIDNLSTLIYEGGRRSSMEAIKSIDELYEEVKDYDIVLCNDAPLTTALNNRVDKAMLGHFAVTPRQLAASLSVELTGKPIIDDIRLVKKVADETGYSLRFVHGEIENFKSALRYASEPRFQGKMSRARKVWEAYRQYNTLDLLMLGIGPGISEYYRGKKVAVIGLRFFDELDKHMVPDMYDEVEIVDYRKDFSIPAMRVLGNDRQIAECAADLAKRCGPNDIAIVMDTGGPMADAVKSALYRESIPFINSLSVRDIGTVRNFLEFIQLALSFETVRVREVRELISAYGGRIYSKYDMYYLSKFRETGIPKSDDTVKILDIMASVRDKKFGYVCTECVPPKERPSVTMLLDQMECLEEYVSQDILDDLVYAVNSIGSLTHNEQLSPDEKTGVLLVDCKNSVFIDRPVVVYTGMCSEWECDLSAIDYIDPKKRPDIEEVDADRFGALIQQGSVRFYLVNATKGGKEAIPCKYFDACIRKSSGIDEDPEKEGRSVKSFSQIAGELVRGPWKIEKRDRTASSGEESFEDDTPPEVFSNSSYVKFLQCPMQYLLTRVADTPEMSSTFTGNRIHEYAEFRISYPEIAKENGPEFYARMIADECAPLNSPDLKEIERLKIECEVKAIDNLIESLGATPGRLVPRSAEKKEPNMFLQYHGLTDVSENSEVSLISRADRLHGIIDLLWDGVAVDFKTGRPSSTRALQDKYDIFKLRSGKGNKYTDAQALFYIALLEDCDTENRNIFELFFAQEAYNQLLSSGQMDIEGCKRRVKLVETNEDYIRLHFPDVLSAKDYADNGIGAIEVCRMMTDRWGPDPADWEEDGDLAVQLAEEHNMYYVKGKNKGQLKVKITATAMRVLKRALEKPLLLSRTEDSVIILRRTIERFKEGLREDMEKLRGYYQDGFPAVPVIKCSDCDCRDMCFCEAVGGDEDVESE